MIFLLSIPPPVAMRFRNTTLGGMATRIAMPNRNTHPEKPKERAHEKIHASRTFRKRKETL